MKARYTGDGANGDPIFDVEVRVPDRLALDLPPTPAMIAAVEAFLGPVKEVSGHQAHSILSSRDYARQCVRKVMVGHPPRIQAMFQRLVAAFILSDADRLADVLSWSRRRFDNQPDGSAIARTKRFPETRAWIEALVTDALSRGSRWSG